MIEAFSFILKDTGLCLSESIFKTGSGAIADSQNAEQHSVKNGTVSLQLAA